MSFHINLISGVAAVGTGVYLCSALVEWNQNIDRIAKVMSGVGYLDLISNHDFADILHYSYSESQVISKFR